ncbi:hypothetical protein BVX95_01110 [archaeon D22]|nr:hypothetical protein BVX95_01110 [archaeon D22]
MKAESYIEPPTTIGEVDETLKVFEDKQEKIEIDSEDGYPEKPKDLKSLLEEKKRNAALDQDSGRVNSNAKLEVNEEALDLPKKDFEASEVMEKSFFIVHHAFSYDDIFESGDTGETIFRRGSIIYLYVEMYNLQEDSNGEIDLAIDFKLKDSNDKTLPGYDAPALVVFTGKPPYKDGYFLARMSIPLSEAFTEGKYYTDLIIKDKVSGVKRAEKYVFRIEEVTLG